MKTFRTLPTENNFFDRYAGLVHGLKKASYLAQIVSAVTEVGVLYALIYNAIFPILPPAAMPAATVGAIVGTLLIEIGLRWLLPHGTRAFLYSRWHGLDLLMSVVILAALAGFLTASGTLSFQGGKNAVAAVATPPELEDNSEAEEIAATGKTEALAAFAADSAGLAKQYAGQIEATRAKYKGLAAAQKAKADRYRKLEAEKGTSYVTARTRAEEKAAELTAEGLAEVAALQSGLAGKLEALQQERKAGLQAAASTLEAARQKTAAKNDQAEAQHAAKVNNWGIGVGWFTVICLVFLIAVIIMDEAHKKGSGIEEKVDPGQYHFAPGLAAELTAATGERWQYFSRRIIQNFADATPAPPLPKQVKPLHNWQQITRPQVLLQVDAGQAGHTITIPQAQHPGQTITAGSQQQATRQPITTQQAGSQAAGKTEALEALEALQDKILNLVAGIVRLESDNLHTAAAPVYLEARQVITAYLGPDATPDNVEALFTACVEYENKVGPNPFEHHHRRRQIGFIRDQAAGDPDATPHFDKKEGQQIALVSCPNCRNLYPENTLEECPFCLAESYREAVGSKKKEIRKEGPKGPEITQQSEAPNALRYNATTDGKNCQQCGQSFKPKVTWQKYCSEACRLEHHAARHDGKRFDPAYHRKEK